jgi:cytochrome c553
MIEMVRGFRVLFALVALLAAPGLAWAQTTGESTQAPADGGIAVGDPARGAELFTLCRQCHGDDALGNPDIQAPAIAGLPGWYIRSTLLKFQSGARGTHPDDIAGMRMRPMSLWLRNEDDVTQVAIYVSNLPPVRPQPLLEGGDATRGAALYAPCMACHMPDGSGNAQIGSPPLNHASDWYLVAQLKKFKAGIRGGNPKDTNGALMVGMSQMLADDQAMKDVVAHIMTLAN